MLEDKIAGILSKTLPNMLTGLLQSVLGLSSSTPQQVPPPAPTVDVAVGSAEPDRVNNKVGASLEVGVQAMDVVHVDGATHMDTPPTTMDNTNRAEANVSIRSP